VTNTSVVVSFGLLYHMLTSSLLRLYPSKGGEDPTQHKIVQVRIEPLNIRKVIRYPDLPLAALPQREKEIRTVYLAKKRPALILSSGGPSVKKRLIKGKPNWQTNPTVIVAPYYGTEQGMKRAGFNPEFLERVRLCEYPQFIWDRLPLNKDTNQSIMRLDHVQPVGRSGDSIEFTDFCLSERALLFLDEWIEWLKTGNLDTTTKLCEIRDVLLNL